MLRSPVHQRPKGWELQVLALSGRQGHGRGTYEFEDTSPLRHCQRWRSHFLTWLGPGQPRVMRDLYPAPGQVEAKTSGHAQPLKLGHRWLSTPLEVIVDQRAANARRGAQRGLGHGRSVDELFDRIRAVHKVSIRTVSSTWLRRAPIGRLRPRSRQTSRGSSPASRPSEPGQRAGESGRGATTSGCRYRG